MPETVKKDALQVLRKKRRLKVIIGILALIIIVGIGGTVYMNRGQEKPVEGPANQIVQVKKKQYNRIACRDWDRSGFQGSEY
nr:hypothetical protein [Paenibacillus polymyxa]